MRILTDQYTAGLFDGEGCVSIAKYYPIYSKTRLQYCLRVYISSTNKEIIETLKENYGGSWSIAKRPSKNKVGYNWNLATDQAYSFLKRIYPYLIIKKEQADTAFAFVEFKKANVITRKRLGTEDAITNQHEVSYLQMRKLNQRGALVA